MSTWLLSRFLGAIVKIRPCFFWFALVLSVQMFGLVQNYTIGMCSPVYYRGSNSVTTLFCSPVYKQEMKMLPTLFTPLYNTGNK